MAEQTNKDTEFLTTARKRYDTVQGALSERREDFLEDVKFVYNVDDGQWEEQTIKDRKDRPCLVSNKLRKYCSQVTNRERDMRMAMKVRPVDNYGDDEIAIIYDGLIRHIEYQSKADEVYTHGGEYAVSGGFGYWRVLSKYIKDGFEQEIYIEKIDNPLSVYLDDRENFCFIREGLTMDEYKAQYPDANHNPMDFSSEEGYELWYENDKVFLSEYFYKELYDKTIVKAINNQDPQGEPKVFEIKDKVTKEGLTANGFTIVAERTFKDYRIKWVKMSGYEVLEKRTLPGSMLPVIKVVGDRVNVDGKIYERSLIKDGKDPQRMYNYAWSTVVETLALQPKAPYIMTAEQIAGYEEMWDDANVDNRTYLLYNEGAGTSPRREPPPTVPTGAISMLQIANSDIPDSIGLSEASFGEKSNERTGAAIQQRASRSDLTTYHYPDNLRRAILQTCRICIEWIPEIYDTERVVRLRTEDGKSETQSINKVITIDGMTVKLNDLSVGRYDIEADIKNYGNRRQELVDRMTMVMQTAPAFAGALLPIIAKYEDYPGADEMKEAIESFTQSQNQPKQGGQVPPQGGTA